MPRKNAPKSEPTPEPQPLPEGYKPKHLTDLPIGLQHGVVVRVALSPSQTAQLEKKNKYGTQVKDLVTSDEKGPILLHLTLERKYAWLVKCQHEGCTDTRVVRTSDIVGPVSVTTCMAHKKSKGKGGSPAPLGDGGLDVSALQPETTSDDTASDDAAK